MKVKGGDGCVGSRSQVPNFARWQTRLLLIPRVLELGPSFSSRSQFALASSQISCRQRSSFSSRLEVTH